MKERSLLLVRHAKSSWEDITQKDFDRPLNERGKKDAPEMAKYLHKKENVELDAIISSPAKRAITTAKYFADEFNIKKKKIIEVEELYEASVENFFNAVIKIDDDHKTVALFSHNPGITIFANTLTKIKVDDMPTCAVYAIHVEINSWKDFKDAEKKFCFFHYPKSII